MLLTNKASSVGRKFALFGLPRGGPLPLGHGKRNATENRRKSEAD
jgi:hypothetical protein